jgi:hypothetical protein
MPSTVKPILVLSDDGSGVSQLGSFLKEYLAKYNSDNSFGFFACEYLSVYYICQHPDPRDLHYWILILLLKDRRPRAVSYFQSHPSTI